MAGNLMESRRPINLITRPQKRIQNHILNEILNETLTPQNRRKMGQSTNLVKNGCSMVVPMNPCRRRGGLWWRMDVGSGGEENRRKGENKGRWRRNARKGERKGWASGFLSSIAGVGSAGHWNFLKIRNRRWECRPLKFFKNQKL